MEKVIFLLHSWCEKKISTCLTIFECNVETSAKTSHLLLSESSYKFLKIGWNMRIKDSKH